MTIYLGLVGLPGAGKSLVLDMLEAQLDNTETVKMGDIVREHAHRNGNETSAEIRNFATHMREKHGKGVFAEKLVEQYTFSEDIVIVDGIRSPEEIEYLKSNTEGPCTIIYVKAPFNTRYQRVVERGRDGEEKMNEEDFREREEEELDWGAREIINEKQFDTTITNDSSLADLELKVSEFIVEYIEV